MTTSAEVHGISSRKAARGRTALYRHFDAGGQLLYVGISLSAVQRLAQHKTGSEWFPKIARVDIEWLPSRAIALRAEAAAIERENPLHNRARPAATLSAPVVVEEPFSFAVLHVASKRVDGWYMRRGVAEHMLGWWRAAFPGEAMTLLEAGRHDCLDISERRLDVNGWHGWARTAPDFGAADRFDREAA